ncbi:hypothetical protein LAZ67_3004846 [Cordylochernes scorpioides]|uniref:Uncharacterized protein n=1 Tax=Cordylochernes scorpioides TaxID=51811 RepID=A0ABY6KCM7_9ARAC|nr:hypothetical protein LAZ67_3004846 [Cordylochernes scorpioides]
MQEAPLDVVVLSGSAVVGREEVAHEKEEGDSDGVGLAPTHPEEQVEHQDADEGVHQVQAVVVVAEGEPHQGEEEVLQKILSDKQLPESNVNLPKINLPIFNGDSANWLSFREIFNSTINSNQTLTEIQKFQYLNASVKGPAEKLIRGFPISDRNYQQAWDTLCNRFNNRRELAFSQINKIFSIRPLKSISTGSLYDILDVCNEGIRNLSVLGLEKNTLTDLILINFF